MPRLRGWLVLRGLFIVALMFAAGDHAVEAWRAETRVEKARALQAEAARLGGEAQVRQVQALEHRARAAVLHWAGYAVFMLLAAAWNVWLLVSGGRLSAPRAPAAGPPSG